MKKIFTLFFIATAVVGIAQSDLTLYNFNAIAQSLHVNPAMPQQTKVWIGLPAVSGVQAHYHNSGFALIDLFEKGTNPNENRDRLIESLDGNSQLTTNTSLDLFGVGFKAGNGFVTLGVQQEVDFRMDYPVDLLRFFNFGNAASASSNSIDASFTLNTFDLEAQVRTNTYLGYQYTINDKLSIGGRFKYIIGQQNGYIERSNAVITTNDTALIINSDMLARTSGSSGFLDEDADPIDPVALGLPQNNGFGVDLGINYAISDRFSVSASVLDLGYIDWNDNNRDYVSNGEFTFTGVDVDFGDENPGEGTEYLVDSIVAAFDFEEVDGQAYRTNLNSRIFVGANYHLTDKHSIGALYHARNWGGEFFHDYSVNYVGKWSRNFQFTTSYSVINGTYNNVGLGFDLKLGPLQLYLISDNVLAIDYGSLQTTNVRVGLNIAFYGKKNKNIAPQEPEGIQLVEPEEE